MLEPQQVFNDLDEIIVQQEPMIQAVERKAVYTHGSLEQGNIQPDRAVTSARAERRKEVDLPRRMCRHHSHGSDRNNGMG
jgi:syntaxin 1B/2/3